MKFHYEIILLLKNMHCIGTQVIPFTENIPLFFLAYPNVTFLSLSARPSLTFTKLFMSTNHRNTDALYQFYAKHPGEQYRLLRASSLE